MKDRLCLSCGAPLKGGTHQCEYCGTDWQPPPAAPHSFNFNLQSVISLVLALVAMPFLMMPWFGIIPAGVGLYFGIDALREIRKNSQQKDGKIMALTGIVLCATLLAVMSASIYLLRHNLH